MEQLLQGQCGYRKAGRSGVSRAERDVDTEI